MGRPNFWSHIFLRDIFPRRRDFRSRSIHLGSFLEVIEYLPTDLLRRMASKKQAKRLVTKELTLNRAALSALAKTSMLSKKKIEELALRVIKDYKARYKEELADGLTKSAALDETLNGARLMVQRVQDSVVHEIAKDIKRNYRGEFYEWLPSDAEEPDPLHQLNYGKKFQIGKGEMPGDRWGCKCGMNILVEEKKLDI